MAIRIAMLFFIRFEFIAMAIRPAMLLFDHSDSIPFAKHKKSTPIGMLFDWFALFLCLFVAEDEATLFCVDRDVHVFGDLLGEEFLGEDGLDFAF